jgi:hypothetical protein
MPKKSLALAVPLFALLLLLQTGCVIDAVPETAVNVVGGSHQVTASLDVDLSDEDCEFIAVCDGDWIALFMILSGPGTGDGNIGCSGTAAEVTLCLNEVFSCLFLDGNEPDECGVDDSGCSTPDCLIEPGDSLSWTYQNNGTAGKDYIVVCMFPEIFLETVGTEQAPLRQPQSQLVQQEGTPGPDEDLQNLIDQLVQFGCDAVTKTWIDPTPTPPATAEPVRRTGVNIGPVLAAADAERRAREQAEQQAASLQQQAGGPIRPPNTGDGGLR